MYTSASAAETEATGAGLAKELRAGDVIALVGDLGSGKTQFVKGVVRGLGCVAPVTSPTFTLLHEYIGGRVSIYHFDFYRIENQAALNAIGFDEYMFGSGVTMIEWADRFPDAIPPTARWVCLQVLSEHERKIEFK